MSAILLLLIAIDAIIAVDKIEKQDLAAAFLAASLGIIAWKLMTAWKEKLR